MKTKPIKIFTFFTLFALFGMLVQAEELRKFASLSGPWRFSIGDDMAWASPQYDDSGWDQIAVPDLWENQGYDDYNGYAWYRKTFKLGNVPNNTTLYLMLGRIDDADAIYLNGKLLGKSGSFPPDFVTAYDKTRKYAIPTGFLKANEVNVIAVRVYDSYLEGGIIDGSIGMYFDAETELLDLNLSGRWKIHAGDNKEWRAADLKDDDWNRIAVPSAWENQGYDDYDGYAWYRVRFRVPPQFITGDLYLSLGKIDDVDDVYLNGKFIGTVYDLRKDGDYKRSGWEFNARRVYKIPAELLKRGEINTLAVRVYDGQGNGGIYEGPIGIMSAENYRKYRNKHYSSQSFWDSISESFFAD